MCTVTVIPTRDLAGTQEQAPTRGRRLVMNRDEKRTRSVAHAPEIRRAGAGWAVFPVDPDSGGTWVAANDAGLVFALLNDYPEEPRRNLPTPSDSRGGIIPSLIGARNCDQALGAAMSLDARRYAPFRLLLLTLRGHVEITADGRQMRLAGTGLGPLTSIWTSSSFGHGLAERERLALFSRLTEKRDPDRACQDSFHRHAWADQPHLSVCMSRPDARTVSRTIIEFNDNTVALRYEPLLDGGDADHAGCVDLSLQIDRPAAISRRGPGSSLAGTADTGRRRASA